jgi:propanol-preferring alcohol dehydrogenase
MMGKDVTRLGIYGFGAAAHIIAQVATHQGKKVYAFTKPDDREGQSFARSLGAVWTGDSTSRPPVPLDGAIIFAPVGPLVVEALKSTAKGASVICAGIHMTDIPSFPYRLLWEERVIRSVANLTRRDGDEFLSLAPEVPVRTEVQTFPLAGANEALAMLRSGQIQGAAVLVMP